MRNPKIYNNRMSITLPAGDYLLVDPCYVMDDKRWDEICGLLDQDILELDGHQFACHGTAHGDGCYETSDFSNQIAVDSGLIGLVPLVLCTRKENKRYSDFVEEHSLKINSKTPIKFEYHDGTFTIQSDSVAIQVWTDGMPCEDCDDPRTEYYAQKGEYLCEACYEKNYCSECDEKRNWRGECSCDECEDED